MTTGPLHVSATRLEVAGLGVLLTFGPGLEAVAEEIDDLWSHLRAADDGAAPQFHLDYALPGGDLPDGALPLRAERSATYTVSGHVTRKVIDFHLGTRLLLHAASVTHPELGTVVMVGESGAGKSTAATYLGRAGHYLTDELTILDPESFAITPYPKPLSRLDAELGAKRDHALPTLELTGGFPSDHAGPEMAVPSAVVLLHRIQDDENNASSTISRVPLPEALVRIVPQTSSLEKVPGGLAALATLLATTGGALEVRYREASELEELLRRLPSAERVEVLAIEGQEEQRVLEEGWLALAPFRQALAVETGVFVLGRSGAVHLSGLTALVWELLEDSGPLTYAELEKRLVLELGEHPDSGALLRTTLDVLVGHGVARQG